MIVTTEVKAMFETKAIAICGVAKIETDKFNQELNAITTRQCLKAIGVELPDREKEPVLYDKMMQVLYKAGNTSANRQALMAPAKKVDQVVNKYSAELDEV